MVVVERWWVGGRGGHTSLSGGRVGGGGEVELGWRGEVLLLLLGYIRVMLHRGVVAVARVHLPYSTNNVQYKH